MKRFFCLLLTLAALFCVPSCGRTVTYRDDLSISALTDTIRSALNHELQYSKADDQHFKDYFTMPSFVRERDVYFSTDGNNLNEFGLFRVAAGSAEEMEAHLKSYLASSLEKNREFYDSYIPEETAKLRDAEVRRYGNYVAYAILDRDGRQSFFSAIEKKLTE